MVTDPPLQCVLAPAAAAIPPGTWITYRIDSRGYPSDIERWPDPSIAIAYALARDLNCGRVTADGAHVDWADSSDTLWDMVRRRS
jgi:hypothetical protein